MSLSTDLTSIALAGKVLERQADHCRNGATYLGARGSITGSTGLILAALGPLSEVVTTLGTVVLRTGGAVCDATSNAARETVLSYQEADAGAVRRLAALGTGLVDGVEGRWAQIPFAAPLGPATASAPSDWGQTDSWLWEKVGSTTGSIGDLLDSARGLTRDVQAWGSPSGGVVEKVDASSYLVEPTADENWIADLRWNAGALLGSVDWVYEQLAGHSFLGEYIFKPFGGDSREVTKAAGAWTNTGAMLGAVADNHASLVATTVEGWVGVAGDAFRVAMAALSEGFSRLTGVCDAVATALGAVALAIKGACAAIGYGLRTLARMLIEAAAELAVPGIGWGIFVATMYWKIERIFMTVRLIYNLIEAVFAAIAAFAEAKALAVDGIGRFEDLAEGVFRRAAQAVP